MSDMTRTHRHPLKRAALDIGRSARELRWAHTVNGKWPAAEREVQLEYFRLAALRRELYEASRA